MNTMNPYKIVHEEKKGDKPREIQEFYRNDYDKPIPTIHYWGGKEGSSAYEQLYFKPALNVLDDLRS